MTETTPVFTKWPKTPRLFRDVVVSEKIDGTNGQIIMLPYTDVKQFHHGWTVDNILATIPATEGVMEETVWVFAASKGRLLTTKDDNYGFAKWVASRAEDLFTVLGYGKYTGEWYGNGIQRNYGLDHKRFALFNTKLAPKFNCRAHMLNLPLETVPVIYEGVYFDGLVTRCTDGLGSVGSYVAADGWTGKPEGICLFHKDSGQIFKVTLENDAMSKSEAEHRKKLEVAA